MPPTTSNDLGYLWRQSSGPSAVTWSKVASSQPTISGMLPGSYTFELTVTDNSGQSSVCTVNDGAVATYYNDVVITNNPAVDTLLGPMVRYGANPWPWYDDRHKTEADMQIADMDPYYGAWWDVADAGTVTVTQGSTTLTGVGTTFTTTFCQGPASPTLPKAYDTAIVVWYLTGNPGQTGRRMEGVVSCQSDTQLTLNHVWAHDVAGGSGLAYGDNSNYGTWAYGASPANYYDNVTAFYALYYRSGIVDYLNAARKLADRFFECPEVDRGESYVTSDYIEHGMWPSRGSSVMGLVLRAMDGRPDMWPGLRKIMDYFGTYYLQPGTYGYDQLPAVWDVRETAYALATLSYCGLFDPDAAHRAACQGWVNSAISHFYTLSRYSDGSWRELHADYNSWTAPTTSVSLTHGSTAVVGAGTSWASNQFASSGGIPPVMWFLNATTRPNSNADGDSAFYNPAYVDGAHLTLDRPYAGTTGTHGWALGTNLGFPVVGYGQSPFTEGLLAEAFDLAAKSITSAYPVTALVAHGYSVDAARWIMSTGYRSTTKSVYYTAGYVNCQPPIPELNNGCTNNYDADGARVISAEAIGGIARAYAYSKDASLKAGADLLFNAMWAKSTTCPANSTLCVSDGSYVISYDDGQWYMAGPPPIGSAPKWFGQMAGFPSLSSWPAIRTGPAQ
jgi:hypothetical protein